MPPVSPYFALYECEPACTEVARLGGGIGTTTTEIQVSLPLALLDLEEDPTLSSIIASTALGEASPGAIVGLDEVELPDASIPDPTIEVGIRPRAGSPVGIADPFFLELDDGAFSGGFDVSAFPPGAYRVWARLCLGANCGSHRSGDVDH